MTDINHVRALPIYEILRESLFKRIGQGWVCPTREKIASALNQSEPEQGQQIVLLMIHYYFMFNSQSNPFTLENCETARRSKSTLPFGIKVSPGGKGLSVDLNSAPDALVMLLAEFCSL